jgi:hypothetical protein
VASPSGAGSHPARRPSRRTGRPLAPDIRQPTSQGQHTDRPKAGNRRATDGPFTGARYGLGATRQPAGRDGRLAAGELHGAARQSAARFGSPSRNLERGSCSPQGRRLRRAGLATPDRAARRSTVDRFPTWASAICLEIADLRITIGGEIAFGHGLSHVTGERADGTTTDLWARITICLRRTDDGWRIAHEHISVPFHMDGSFRAAVDLKP